MQGGICPENNAIGIEEEEIGRTVGAQDAVNVRCATSGDAAEDVGNVGGIVEEGFASCRNGEMVEAVEEVSSGSCPSGNGEGGSSGSNDSFNRSISSNLSLSGSCKESECEEG